MVVTQVGVSLGEATTIPQIVVEDSSPTIGMATLRAVVSLGITATTITTILVEAFSAMAITITAITTLEASSIIETTLEQVTVLSVDLLPQSL